MAKFDTQLHELQQAMARLDEDRVKNCAQSLQQDGCGQDRIQRALDLGLKEVGALFERGEYFFADLLVSGMIYREMVSNMMPEGLSQSGERLCRTMIGVVQDDIHDIGKDIVVSLLQAEGFEVIDLGVDVRPEQFIEEIKKKQPRILLLSGMLKMSQNAMEVTLEAIKKAGLREKLFIVAGGGCVDAYVREHLDADAFGSEPSETLSHCKKFWETRKSQELE